MARQEAMAVAGAQTRHQTRRYAVIGTGAAGLCSAKYLLQAGLRNVTIFEIGTQIGGLWCYENDNGRSSAYRTLHINSPKSITSFHDFPFDKDVQVFPDHKDMHDYLVAYAKHFDLVRHVRFNTRVVDVRPSADYAHDDPKWEVETQDGKVEIFDRVIVATGHLSDPLHVKAFRGAFAGEYIHSHYYRAPEPFLGKRVCIVGAGNSACDIASDICMIATRTVLVARSGVRISPKLVFGMAFHDFTMMLEKRWIPKWVRRWAVSAATYMIHGRMTDLGFKPAKKRAHGTSNAVIVHHIKYQRVQVKQGLERIEGKRLFFPDGTSEEFDVLIAATGYKIDLPFISPSIVPIKDNVIDLYKRIVPPSWKGLYFVGFLNTSTSLPNAHEHQVRWLLAFEEGRAMLPSVSDMLQDIEAKKAFLAREFSTSARHTIEEPHLIYLPELARSLREAEGRMRRHKPDARIHA